jgi:hypothetical protein
VLGWTGAAALAGLSGCSSDLVRRVEPDTTLRADVVRAKRALVAAYDATAQAHPALRDRLVPLRADHTAHLDVLGALPPATTSPLTPSGSPTVPAVAASPQAALRALARAESAAAAQRLRDCVAAESAELARLLAAIGGSEAVHAARLSDGSP